MPLLFFKFFRKANVFAFFLNSFARQMPLLFSNSFGRQMPLLFFSNSFARQIPLLFFKFGLGDNRAVEVIENYIVLFLLARSEKYLQRDATFPILR